VSSVITQRGEGSNGGMFGLAVAGAGDVNGDGYPELIVGAPTMGSYAGEVALFRSAASGITASTTPVLFDGTANTQLGSAVY
jgi:hypothetical protein